MLRQASAQTSGEIEELATQMRQLERQLTRDHGEIRSLVAATQPTSATSARIADLHERIAWAESQLLLLRSRNADVERQRIDAIDVAAAFADFDNVWANLTSREQAHVLELLVARVEFDAADSTVAMTFHPSAIKALAKGNQEEAA